MDESGKNRLIFALDVGNELGEALRWVELLRDNVGMFKIGKEAYTRFGPEIVTRIHEIGGEVFLDLKYHDIPNTVAQAGKVAASMGVKMFNVHALGGRTMMEKTAQSVVETPRPKGMTKSIILAVTVLTSLDEADLREIGFDVTTKDLVVRLARLAQASGMSGVVASPKDIEEIRRACGANFLIVTPGIRLQSNATKDDQKRVLTPMEAVEAGADYIVVGRPIRSAKDPVSKALEICMQISKGLESRFSRGIIR